MLFPPHPNSPIVSSSPRPKSLWLSFFFLSSLILPTGNLILDAMSVNSADFELELARWQASGLTGTSKSFQCGRPYIGGKGTYNNGGYAQRVYDGLPSHSIIYYSLKIVIIDLWDPANSFSVYIDNTPLISNWNPGLSQAGLSNSYCGDSYYDQQEIFVIGKVNHASSSLTLKIVFNLASSPLSGGIGFRSINLQLVQGASGEAEEPACVAAVGRQVPGVPACGHVWNQYIDSGTPQTCSGPCTICFGLTQCYLLEAGYTFDGTQPIACHSSCNKCSGPDANQCTVCNGNPSNWNYWDYTCRATCDPPNIPEGTSIRRCLAPCESQETFALWDNTCSITCDSPLTQRIEGRAKFCDFPCVATQMAAADGSCTSLSSPCESPATLLTIAGRQVCKHPCPINSDFYFENDGSCKSTCLYPYKIEIKSLVKVCKLDITADEAHQAEQIAELTGISALAAKAAGMVVSFINANNAGLLFMASMTEILQYIRFLRINYPPKLQRVLDEQTENLDSLSIIDTPSFVEDTFPLNEIPEEFAKNNLHSSFCVNFWQSLALLAIIIAILPIVCLLEIIAKNIKLLQSLLNKTRSSLQWNLILSVFCSTYGTIALYTVVEFRATNIDSVASGLSLLTNCFINGIGLFVLISILRFCVNFQKVKRKPIRRGTAQRQIDKFLASWKRYEVLYDSYKDSSAFQQMFIFMFMLRTYFHYAIVAIFNDYPFYQTIALTIISVLIILYLIFKRPMKSVSDYIQQLICEVAILIVNICVVILAAMEKWNSGTHEIKEKIGDAIIGVQISLTAVLLLFLAIEIIVVIKGVWLSCKAKANRLEDRHLIPSRSLNNSAISINLAHSNSPSQASRIQINNSILDQSIEKEIERMPRIVGPPQDQDVFQKRKRRKIRRRDFQ